MTDGGRHTHTTPQPQPHLEMMCLEATNCWLSVRAAYLCALVRCHDNWNYFPLTSASAEDISNVLTIFDNKLLDPEELLKDHLQNPSSLQTRILKSREI